MYAWTYDSQQCICSHKQIHHIITIHLAYIQSPRKSPSLSIYAFTDNVTINYISVFTNNITINQHICIHQQYHTISHNPNKGENTSTKINIIFNTYQSFIYLHIIISNYPQKICQVFGLKDHFWKVHLPLYNFKIIETNEPKPSK